MMRKGSNRSIGVRVLAMLAAAAMAATAGCGDDTDGGGGGNGGGGGSGGGDTTPAACEGLDLTGCTISLGPSEDDTNTLQTALIEAESGSTVCLCTGTYSVENELQVTTPDLTIRGVGEDRDAVVIDFANQIGGDDGLTATADGFTVENFSVKNSPGNGIVVTGAQDVVFRNVHVSWDGGPSAENGAYAVYPVGCTNVLVEDCEIEGAADAGVYVGQSTNIIVRGNDVHENVAGVEIENSNDAEVYDNQAYDNTAGILVFTLPGLEKKDGLRTSVHDNEIYDNNRENFAAGGVVAFVPPGVGLLLLAADETQIHSNTFTDNESTSILIVSYSTLQVLIGDDPDDPQWDPDPENTFISGNTFTNNGTDPREPVNVAALRPVEDVLWDGVEKEEGSGDLCLSMTPPSFRNLHSPAGLGNDDAQTTATTDHECEKDLLDPIELDL